MSQAVSNVRLARGVRAVNMNVHTLMEMADNNFAIVNAFAKCWDILGRYRNPVVSISGGADSDIVLDMIYRLDDEHKCRYVWFNTGLEYSATKRHLIELEQKYNIQIERIPAVKSIPQCVKEYGQPFISKNVSDNISRLQLAGFDFSDGHNFENDIKAYPKVNTGIEFWHNRHTFKMWNIDRHKHLKEFLIANPPQFRISNKCCYYAKKITVKKFIRANNCDLNIIGIRKAEGGIREAVKSCFNDNGVIAILRPVFWFKDEDKKRYCEIFGVTHSECYTVYGLKRTGCAGCPFNRNLFSEIEQIRNYEGGLISAASKVFAETYEYTRRYKEFYHAHQGATLPLF